MHKTDNSCQTDDDSILIDNNTLFKLLMETKSSLDNFMLKINSDQSKLHDEITSIKKRFSLEHSKLKLT